MIIANSNIAMGSTHDLEVSHQESVLRRITTGRALPEEPRETAENPAFRPVPGDGVRVTLSHQSAIQYAFHATETYSGASTATDSPEDGATSEQRTKLSVLLKTLEKMTGKAYHFSETRFQPVSGLAPSESQLMKNTPSEASSSSQSTPAAPQNTAGTQIETLTAFRHNENEKTTFSAAGTIKTSDGREIAIEVQLNMSREFHEADVAYRVETRPLTDPLVINLSGSAAGLTEKKYAFDINSDGEDEQISFVTPGAGGFLARDRNKDGVINNGSELFGPTQGNGFSELAECDEDGNGWIDERDGVFYDLSIWSKTADGKDQLIAVADTGIGAIYLNATETPFAVTTDNNEKLGQVRRSSVYVNENGSAGVIQQVDLVQ
ncbi:MAG: hypothetical protein V2B19_03390 [Pseudomonadota bacterium]